LNRTRGFERVEPRALLLDDASHDRPRVLDFREKSAGRLGGVSISASIASR